MRKVIILFIFILCSWAMNGQTSLTIQTSPRNFILNNTGNYGRQLGYFRFDSLTGSFTRSGNQVQLFRAFMKFQNAQNKRLELAENVLRWIDSTGKIQYPIEYMEDLRKWNRQ